MEIVVAVIGALALLAVELWRRRGEKKRGLEAAATERGDAYETFVGDALSAIRALQSLVAFTPKLAFLPVVMPAREAVRDAQSAQEAVARSHARVRRLAPDDVADASDKLLEALHNAAQLTAMRQRDAAAWDKVWDEARSARIEFERLARVDALRHDPHRAGSRP